MARILTVEVATFLHVAEFCRAVMVYVPGFRLPELNVTVADPLLLVWVFLVYVVLLLLSVIVMAALGQKPLAVTVKVLFCCTVDELAHTVGLPMG